MKWKGFQLHLRSSLLRIWLILLKSFYWTEHCRMRSCRVTTLMVSRFLFHLSSNLVTSWSTTLSCSRIHHCCGLGLWIRTLGFLWTWRRSRLTSWRTWLTSTKHSLKSTSKSVLSWSSSINSTQRQFIKITYQPSHSSANVRSCAGLRSSLSKLKKACWIQKTLMVTKRNLKKSFNRKTKLPTSGLRNKSW